MICWGIGRGFIMQLTITKHTLLKGFGSIGPTSGGTS